MTACVRPIRLSGTPSPAPQQPAPGPRNIWGYNAVDAARALHELWVARPCWVCSQRGPCGHREPEFDMAWLEARGRR
jgi:hypothetical protein